MILMVTNTGNNTERIDLRSGQRYDFIVSRDGREVWRWSADKMFTQALTTITLGPDETITFRDRGLRWTTRAGRFPSAIMI